jgi:hypothetical protein
VARIYTQYRAGKLVDKSINILLGLPRANVYGGETTILGKIQNSYVNEFTHPTADVVKSGKVNSYNPG